MSHKKKFIHLPREWSWEMRLVMHNISFFMLQRHKNIFTKMQIWDLCKKFFYDYYLFGRLGMRLSTNVYSGQSILHELVIRNYPHFTRDWDMCRNLWNLCSSSNTHVTNWKYNFVAIHGGQFSFVTFCCNLIPILQLDTL